MGTNHLHSSHYVGAKGESYFCRQRAQGDIGGIINARAFQKYVRKDDCVLDFGCGGGFLLKHLLCGRRLGVEINPAARLIAKENGIECYDRLSQLEGQIVDVVISNHALEHVPAPVMTLTEMSQTIKPGGLLVLRLPIDDWRVQRSINPKDINHHLYTWTPQLLFNCLSEAGFHKSQIEVGIYTHAWFPGYKKAFQILPESVFDLGCRLFSILRKRRQLVAVAVKSPDALRNS